MENNNSVCYVARINEIKEIPGADNIEQGVIGGWNCIIKKGEYEVDDLVVVATTDAVIPQELSDTMNVTNYLRKGQRVRTVKLRGVYSECLIIPLRYARQSAKYTKLEWNEGKDMMDVLDIFKYEPPVVQVQLASGRKIRYQKNPNFHVYHKFPNLKNVPDMFDEEDHVQITRKMHGTNARYGIVKKLKLSFWDKFKKFFRLADEWIEYEYVYGSHNVEKGSDSQGFYDTDVWMKVADKFELKEKLWNLFKVAKSTGAYQVDNGIVIYGEIFGPGIQKNYDYGLEEIEFEVFDITMNGEYLDPMRTLYFCDNLLLLPHVKVLYTGAWSQEVQDKHVFGNFIEGTKIPHEGIVIKHHTGERNKVAKVINPEYLTFDEKNNSEEDIKYAH
jgi:RNA ligase (TIGR02306 family)